MTVGLSAKLLVAATQDGRRLNTPCRTCSLMPQTIAPLADETPSDIAARLLGDASFFREVIELNPALDPFIDVMIAAADDPDNLAGSIAIPLRSELASRTEPALRSVREGVSTALSITNRAITEAQSYAQIAEDAGLIEFSADVNGVFGPIENALAIAQESVERYTSAEGAIQLVDWLIGS